MASAAPSLPPSSSFSFKTPLPPSQAQASGSGSSPAQTAAVTVAAGTVAAGQKQRRVSLALPSSPGSFPHGTSATIRACHTRTRRARGRWGGEGEDVDAVTIAPGAPEKGKEKEKKVRRKWTPEETQMLVDGCNIPRPLFPGPGFIIPRRAVDAGERHTDEMRRGGRPYFGARKRAGVRSGVPAERQHELRGHRAHTRFASPYRARLSYGAKCNQKRRRVGASLCGYEFDVESDCSRMESECTDTWRPASCGGSGCAPEAGRYGDVNEENGLSLWLLRGFYFSSSPLVLPLHFYCVAVGISVRARDRGRGQESTWNRRAWLRTELGLYCHSGGTKWRSLRLERDMCYQRTSLVPLVLIVSKRHCWGVFFHIAFFLRPLIVILLVAFRLCCFNPTANVHRLPHTLSQRSHAPPALPRARRLAFCLCSALHSPIASSSASNLPMSSTTSKPNRSTHPDGTPLFPLPSPAHPKRRPFSAEEDSALLAGFRKHGAAWAAIAKDAPVFGVTGRRSMDLRDRFRNAWPGEYERAGYKARPRAVKKVKDKDKDKEKDGGKGKNKMKEEDKEGEGEGEDEPRGRARVGRAQTDQGLAHTHTAATHSPSTAGGAVRRRRRAHTSQGFKSVSMPPSVVGSDDEGASDFGGVFGFGAGGASSEFGMNFGKGGGGDFGFRFTPGANTGAGTAKGEEIALVGGMRHLDMAPADEAMPDAPTVPTQAQDTSSQDPQTPQDTVAPMPPPPPPPAPSTLFQAHFLQQRRAEELALGMHAHTGGGGPTIGRSAWGTQDWFSANPRLDPPPQCPSIPPLRRGLASYNHPRAPHSPPLSSSASFSTPGREGEGGLFERAHGVMERGGGGAYAVGSPALSFHSASLSLDTHSYGHFSRDDARSLSHHSYSHSLSEVGTRDEGDDVFDEDSSAFSIADSEPGGGGAASWAGGGPNGGGGGGGGFRGFTHHSNTAGDLIFGARTHQPIWTGMDAWGARGLGFGRGTGLAGIAEAHGGKRGEEGDAEADAEAQAGEDGTTRRSACSASTTLSTYRSTTHPTPTWKWTGTPPRTPLLRASPAPARTVHVHHHHHHHHHYAATARSVSVPPGEAPEEGLGLGLLGLMSAPATPALGAAATLTPPSAFALDPTLLGLSAAGTMHPHRAIVNTLHTTPMGPTAGAHGPGHSEAMYDLPFLDLHYFGGGGSGVGDAQMQQMQLDGWRGGEALDLARSTTAGAVGGQQAFAPSAFSFAEPQLPQTVSQAQSGVSPPPAVWKALGIPASLRQHIPARPLMRRASAGPPAAGNRPGAGTSASGVAGGGGAHVRSVSHQRGQSAVVRPQDLVLNTEAATSGSGPKGKRKRASWDGGGW
ncbi:hypothetical protein B0H13DRAFT_2664474 [Mycena leptocephala]|nr:hypothetical protein B0H13DRAFT_2664474 [Mycena leptocephala]